MNQSTTKKFKLQDYLMILMVLCVANLSHADEKTNSQPSGYVFSNKLPTQENMLRNTSPDSSVVLSFANQIGESYDIKGQSANVVEQCIQGDTITGIEWNNVELETVGDSFLSEATIKFSDSTRTGGVELSVGFGTEEKGKKVFSSNGIFDLTDNAVADISSLLDKQFVMEFFELVDDDFKELDARYLSGTITVHGINLTKVNGCPFIAAEQKSSDLSVTLSSSSAQKNANGTIGVMLEVKNETEVEAVNPVATLSYSNSLELKNQSCSDSTVGSVDGSQLMFGFQNFAKGSVTCELEFDVVNDETMQITAQVSADNDSDTTNNSFVFRPPGQAVSVPLNNKLFLFLLGLMILVFATRKIQS